ncbi:MAG: SDR family NAD(P)-dependent oxidoreductase [Deltaproteobacteria bacterium]|nr:SDR family NAD(P)-dependent oxidoreductase [Deltaproteobacteria bacterium]
MILITGASSGIGEACARIFALDPRTRGLILLARRKDRLEKLAKELRHKRTDFEVHVIELDVRRRKLVAGFAKANAKLLANANVLINSAGMAAGFDPIQQGKTEDWDATIDTNVKGLLYMTHIMLPHFLDKNDGHIVNLGSVAGYEVYPKGNIYCASKFAVRAINESLRMDLLGTKIRVSSVSPGMVETEFSRVRLGDKKKADAVYAGMTPLTGQDIAEAIHWCVRRPRHVNIQDMIIYPTDQASPTLVSRK